MNSPTLNKHNFIPRSGRSAAILGALSLTIACGGPSDGPEAQVADSPLHVTKYEGGEIISSLGQPGWIRTELVTDEGLVDASARTPVEGGPGEIRIRDSGWQPLSSPLGLALKDLHTAIYEAWDRGPVLSSQTLKSGPHCFIGSNPSVPVTCNATYCAYPAPHQAWGGIVSTACRGEAYCKQQAASCGATVPLWFLFWAQGKCHESCMWF